MQLVYKNRSNIPIAGMLFFVSLLLLSYGRVAAQVKDSTVTGIYTDFHNYWYSGISSNNIINPDTSHSLLAFTFRGKIYSTGVNNVILNTKLGSNNYSAQVYKALPVKNIDGTVVAGNSTYIATAIKNDGDSTKAAYTTPYPTIHIADVLTDGKNGLDLGTGVTNLPKGAHISFTIKNLSAKASTDSIPDLVFTQIADPTASAADTIFFYDVNGKIVGNQKLVYWNTVSKLGTYKLDLYTLTNTACNSSTINGMFQQNTTRDIRMVAFLLTEFGITNSDSAAKVKGIQINPNGTSDQAFIAYNTNLINLDVPVINAQPQSQIFCSATTTSATFSVAASSSTTMSYQWKKNGGAIAGATSSSYTATGLTLADTANAYTVTITNSVGSVTSDNATIRYVIIAQPGNQYVAAGASATFSLSASGATAFQWYKNGVAISGATSASYTILSTSLSLSGSSYYAVVSYSGGTCTSNVATLTVENLPAITTQPQAQVLCTTTTTSATFSVTGSSTSTISYQWYKNNAAITGATASTYTATGLVLADTVNTYNVILTNGVGATSSSMAGVRYIILTQPTGQYVATGTAVNFSVSASGATAYQWQKGGVNINGATLPAYNIPAAALSDSGSYTVAVTHAGGVCTSNAAILMVEDLPAITTQPLTQTFCSNSTTSVTFSVVATSTSALSYQWKKNGASIIGATSSSYTATGLTLDDTLTNYKVVVTNAVGSVTSRKVNIKYVIVSQPSPANAYLATGNTITFSAAVSSVVSAFQWKKNGTSISGATSASLSIATVNTTDAGAYTLDVFYSGGTCTTNASVLTTSTVLYSKPVGNINNTVTWGVMTDGTGSTPVDFTRAEHTFIVANRDTATTTANLVIAGTLDVANAKTTIAPGTTLEAGRIIRSLTTGTLAGTATSGLIIHGASHLYFDTAANILQSLLINTIDTVKLHTPLNITAGSAHGIVNISAGTFSTGDMLTLKSNALGTAAIGTSAGKIIGKVTVERFIPARRAWRLFCAPVAGSNAPSINTAWQEGAMGSTSNPNPGFGTHITYGAESSGYDQNPQKSFSMYVYNNGNWSGVPPTKTTLVTDYTAYFLFIRGDRSYDITTTTSNTTPRTTILRTTGDINQGTQTAVPVSASGLTLVGNPYASPVNFESIYQHASNLAHRLRIWNPDLGGTYGVGAYVLLYWDGSDYSAVPNVTNASALKYIQANQGFFVESTGGAGSLSIMESDKDTTNIIIPFGKKMPSNKQTASKLEVNLKVLNEDSTTSIADGVAYLFNNRFNNKIDNNDAVKVANTAENLGINSNNSLLTMEQHTMPTNNDSFYLSLTGTKTKTYQLECIASQLAGIQLYLYDKYLTTLSSISNSDTSRFAFDVNTSITATKASDRFIIIAKKATVLPLTFTGFNANTNSKAIPLKWSIANEENTLGYEVEKSCDGIHFSKAGRVMASGLSVYSFTDAVPCNGNNFYRIKSVSINGTSLYSKVVSILFNNDNNNIAVYPNPLNANHFLLVWNNEPAGTYRLTISSSTGQIVYKTKLLYDGMTAMQMVILPSILSKGIYQLEVASDKKKEVLKLLCSY